MRIDVQVLDCDFLVFSGHKVFAPTGIGAVYGKRELLEAMPPWQGGGNMIQDVTFEKTVYQQPPFKFEAGTGNIADAVGLGAALEWLARLGVENVARHEHALLEYFLRNIGRVLTRPMLAEHVWGLDFDPESNIVDVYVGYLRRKIDGPGEPRLLHTVRGAGYVLRSEPP